MWCSSHSEFGPEQLSNFVEWALARANEVQLASRKLKVTDMITWSQKCHLRISASCALVAVYVETDAGTIADLLGL